MPWDADKTEPPTQRRLEEAVKRGQFPHSVEVQTVLVVGGALLALVITGRESWGIMRNFTAEFFSNLHSMSFSTDELRSQFNKWVITYLHCVIPIFLWTCIGGVVATAFITGFRTASEALRFDPARLNPIEGLKRILSFRTVVPFLINLLKLTIIIVFSWATVKEVLNDPIFYTSVEHTHLATFLVNCSLKLMLRIGGVLIAIATIDYLYQRFRTYKDLMMTKQELKEELKELEGDPFIKAARRRRHVALSRRKMLAQVPKADVVITNPTFIAVALKYDYNTMNAPVVIAKGIRLFAKKIKQIAIAHGIPVVENKPLAQLLYKYCKVNSEIPAMLYSAVAELLAWVYKTNPYKYYIEIQRMSSH